MQPSRGAARSVDGLVEYSGVARPLVIEAKQPWGRSMIRWWATGLASICPDDIDVVTWVPASAQGRSERGHDHWRLLARSTARLLGRPTRRLLRRRGGGPQHERSRGERLEFAELRAVGPTRGRRVLLVDDVHTTGSSVQAATAVLLGAGARTVDVRVLAVVPD